MKISLKHILQRIGIFYSQWLKNPIYILCNVFGLRFIAYKIWPRKVNQNLDPPSTIFIWIIGVYTALWSIASQRYENRIDVIENRATYTISELSTPYYRDAINRLVKIQKMECPIYPNLWRPISVAKSIWGTRGKYENIVEQVKETLKCHKGKLDSTNLNGVDLSYTNLANASFVGAKMKDADLSYCNLDGANFKDAAVNRIKLDGASMRNVDFRVMKNGGALKFYSDGKIQYCLDDRMVGLLYAFRLNGIVYEKSFFDIEKVFPELFVLEPPSPPSGLKGRFVKITPQSLDEFKANVKQKRTEIILRKVKYMTGE